ncbi:MAG: protein ndvB, partial [Rhizobiaceae bacterium]|nr:protein ndvB [Rhizobiaceae bacterium]
GNNRARTAPTIVPARDPATGALLARCPYSIDFGERVAFLACDGQLQTVTADRQEFIGRGGTVEWPRAATSGARLSDRVEAGVDPCAALACDVEIPAGGEAALTFLLGDAASTEEASALVVRHRAPNFEDRLAANETTWRGFLDTFQVETPDRDFDAMVNHWLPYQSLACRIRARSAFYQASGAFGFRDQLQDTLALLLHDPDLARAQILNAASRQFPEGDVQHWWLPRTGAGVRTIISDDVVWLAYAVHRYVRTTGDETILDEEVMFIEGDKLSPGQHDAFFVPEVSRKGGTIYEHCVRALDLAVSRTSANGLPLILGGDWNDGMNRVGEAGKGESIWLGWFLLKTLGNFAHIARGRGAARQAKAWEKHAAKLKRALEHVGWDGEWYRRGSYDDGSPLGSRNSDECQIDSIAQSWSVLSGEGDPVRSRTAMEQAAKALVDDELKIIKLFAPPFEATSKEPGYIKSYPPGVRENGGQYTHAAIWFVIALAEMGRGDEAYRAFSMLNPINHALDEDAAERYRTEPYVVAADIYSAPDKAGRGGWTWYTGSAGWLYRAAVESILGIRREGDRLIVTPTMPDHWDGYSATLRLSGTCFRIRVARQDGLTGPIIEANGRRKEGAAVEIGSGGDVDLAVLVPTRQPNPVTSRTR